ncbi:uncharacterized protein LOC119413748 [Nematolebias whitei]|uniref:uncharacterized protein LOC119413748 n=1 Tax=Nematolebias whitei TaxID=451745 RepID=UPI00189899F2|nr:uncharacterized protein LOC119413748 [Nematolebias whitei]
MDPVLCLEHEIRKAQINKESVVAVFFDVEKAYDMMWREGLLIKMKKMGITGRMFKWIKNFLSDRQIQVRIGQDYSDKYYIENGTPQGSIVSPLLFSIMINDMFDGVEIGMGRSLFADDGALWKRGKNLQFIIKKVQEAITTVEKWSNRWGLKFSVEKTKSIIFTRKKTPNNNELKLYGKVIEREKQFKFLGIWFDERLTWTVHIQKVADKCKKILNIMRCLTGKDWGADRKAQRTIYTGLIRSITDYGSIVYSSASETNLEKLNSIQYQALRIITGAFKTTHTGSILVEMGEPPLNIRREQLALNYWANLKGHEQNHPTQEILKPCWEKEKKHTKNFGWTINQKSAESQIDDLNVSPTVPLPNIHPWLFTDTTVDLKILEQNRNGLISNTVIEHINKYYGYVKIYTDASKNTAGQIGAAFIVPEFGVKVGKRLNNKLSVYTGEMVAILLAVQWIEDNQPLRSVICSDSSSSVISIKNSCSESRPDILIEIQQTLFKISMMGLTVTFLWIPAHIGIRGNEMADKAAKEATKHNSVEIEVKFSRAEIKSITKQRMREKWQKQWEEERKGRWFYIIQRKVGEMRRAERNRREETVISRLRFGHTGLNRTLFIIGKHNTGKCDHCGEDETIQHVLMICQNYHHERRQMIQRLNAINVRFDPVVLLQANSSSASTNILLKYLKRTQLFERI